MLAAGLVLLCVAIIVLTAELVPWRRLGRRATVGALLRCVVWTVIALWGSGWSREWGLGTTASHVADYVVAIACAEALLRLSTYLGSRSGRARTVLLVFGVAEGLFLLVGAVVAGLRGRATKQDLGVLIVATIAAAWLIDRGLERRRARAR